MDVISAVSPFFPHISAYYSEPPTRESAPQRLTGRLLVLKFLYKVRFPYTADTYNDPQKLWTFA